MGLDLKLIPDMFPENDQRSIFPHTMIDLRRDPELFDAIRNSDKTIPLGTSMLFYVVDGLKRIVSDNYGFALTFITAKELCDISAGVKMHPWNMAVMAMMSLIPPKTRVVLYWH